MKTRLETPDDVRAWIGPPDGTSGQTARLLRILDHRPDLMAAFQEECARRREVAESLAVLDNLRVSGFVVRPEDLGNLAVDAVGESVYVFWPGGDDDLPIYIGRSDRTIPRLRQHRREMVAGLWREIAWIEVLPTARSREIEALFIRVVRPAYNRAGVG